MQAKVLQVQLLLKLGKGGHDRSRVEGLVISLAGLIPVLTATGCPGSRGWGRGGPACCSELSRGSGRRGHRTIVLEYHGSEPVPQQTRGRRSGSAWSLPQRGSSNPWRLRQEKLGQTEEVGPGKVPRHKQTRLAYFTTKAFSTKSSSSSVRRSDY